MSRDGPRFAHELFAFLHDARRVDEGINNRIKVIKRIAYFFLKIRAAFPGVGR